MKLFKLAAQLSVLCVFPLTGCARSDEAPAAPSSLAVSAVSAGSVVSASSESDRRDIAALMNPAYKPASGQLSECLGRLAFDVPAKVQWPTFEHGRIGKLFVQAFSREVAGASEILHFGDYKIAVFEAPTAAIANGVKFDVPSVAIARAEKNISETRAAIEKIKADKPKEIADLESYLERRASRIPGWEEDIAKIKQNTFPIKTAIPGAEMFGVMESVGASDAKDYLTISAYVTRGPKIYVFQSQKKIGANVTRDSFAAEFNNILKQFRTRADNEVPRTPGVCIPFGFLSDDGKTPIDMRRSYRLADAPGVLYTIHTGSKHVYVNRSVTAEASDAANIGQRDIAGDEEVKDFITKRIAPQPYKIGGVNGVQGGVAAKIPQPGGKAIEAYNVFTGYSGKAGDESLPFILVDLKTVIRKRAPELPSDPPPFEQSFGRLQTMLKSIRLRPVDE